MFVRSYEIDWFGIGTECDEDDHNQGEGGVMNGVDARGRPRAPTDPRSILIPLRKNNAIIMAAQERAKDWNLQRTAMALRYFLPFPIFTPPLFLVFCSHPDMRLLEAIQQRMSMIDAISSYEEREQYRSEYEKLERQRKYMMLLKREYCPNHYWDVTINPTTVLDVYEQVLSVLYHLELSTDALSTTQMRYEHRMKDERKKLDEALRRLSVDMILRMKDDEVIKEVVARMNSREGRFVWSKAQAKSGVFQKYAEAFFKHMFRYMIGMIHIYEIALLNILRITEDIGDKLKMRKQLMLCSKLVPDTSAESGLCTDRLRRMVHEEQIQILSTKTKYFGEPGFDLKACRHGKERYKFRRCLSPFAMTQMIEYLFTATGSNEVEVKDEKEGEAEEALEEIMADDADEACEMALE